MTSTQKFGIKIPGVPSTDVLDYIPIVSQLKGLLEFWKDPKGWVIKNKRPLVMFFMPIIVQLLEANIENRIISYPIGVLITYVVAGLMLAWSCYEQKRPTDWKKAYTLAYPVAITMIIYSVVLLVLPHLGKTPVTAVIAMLGQGIVGAIIIGYIVFLVYRTIQDNASYCKDPVPA